jgi:hypothetical protein
MWVGKEIIPALIDAVEITIRETLEAYEQDDLDANDCYDPNDLTIFASFVLPVLNGNVQCGFHGSAMLGKGFGFMMGLVPWYLNSHQDSLSKSCFGELVLLHFRYQMKEALAYVNHWEPEWVIANLDRINQQVENAKFTIGPKGETVTSRSA